MALTDAQRQAVYRYMGISPVLDGTLTDGVGQAIAVIEAGTAGEETALVALLDELSTLETQIAEFRATAQVSAAGSGVRTDYVRGIAMLRSERLRLVKQLGRMLGRAPVL